MITPELVTRAVAQIRKSAANYDYFFEHLDSPEWLEPLSAEGFFSSPPEPVREGQYVSFPGWAESRYLARMAAVESAAKTVFAIAMKIPTTENVRVHHDLVQVALALPPELGAHFVPAAKRWARSQYQLLLPEELGKLVQRLAAHGQVRASLDLASSLLAFAPESPRASDAVFSREPRAYFDAWHYSQILQKNIPALIDAAGDRALRLLSDLLEDALNLSRSAGDTDGHEDYSWIWRHAIEDHEQNSGHSLKDALVAAVRDGAERIARREPQRIKEVVETLEARRWTVFRRLALHVAAEFAAQAMQLAEARVADKSLFDDHTVRHEYYRLSRAAFGLMSPRGREAVLTFIEQGTDADRVTRRMREVLGREPTNEELVRYQRTWQIERLSPLKDSLPHVWADRYREWTTAFGEPQHPEFPAYTSHWVGTTSPVSADELRSLRPEEVVEYLNSWEPKGDWRGPSREGLAEQLRILVAGNAEKYAPLAPQFSGARPIYVRAFVAGVRAAIAQGNAVAWGPILDLFERVASAELVATPPPTSREDDDPDFGWTRKAIADFLADALQHEERAPPLASADQVWRILKRLAADRDPTPEDESRFGPPNMDWFTMSLNTTRGQALHAVVNYALWASRSGLVADAEPRRVIAGLPDLRTLLEERLQTRVEPSKAVRAVYGQKFDVLAYLDLEWVRAHLDSIFPLDPQQKEFRDTAWDAYVMWCSPQKPVFDLIRREYERAVETLRGGASKHGRDPRNRLAEHLMILYWWGDLHLGGHELLTQFFASANDDVRGHAIDFIGRSLCGPEAPPDDVLGRLQALWEWRTRVARQRPAEHVDELSGFGWWFSSGRFEPGWALEQLRAVVKLARKVEPAHQVIESLASIAPARPLDALRAFDELAEADQQGWVISAAREDAEKLLEVALRDPTSREEATSVVHRLGARGHVEFRELLRRANA